MDPTTVPVGGANPFAALTFIAAPALLTNASSLLLLGTTNRLARAVDRVRALASQLEHCMPRRAGDRRDRTGLMQRAEQRVRIIVRAMTAFYLAVGSFAFGTMLALVGAALVTPAHDGRAHVGAAPDHRRLRHRRGRDHVRVAGARVREPDHVPDPDRGSTRPRRREALRVRSAIALRSAIRGSRDWDRERSLVPQRHVQTARAWRRASRRRRARWRDAARWARPTHRRPSGRRRPGAPSACPAESCSHHASTPVSEASRPMTAAAAMPVATVIGRAASAVASCRARNSARHQACPADGTCASASATAWSSCRADAMVWRSRQLSHASRCAATSSGVAPRGVERGREDGVLMSTGAAHHRAPPRDGVRGSSAARR